MLIDDESPLRRLPKALNINQTLFLDAIRYSIEMADMSYTRLQDALLKLQTLMPKEPLLTGTTVSMLSDAWLIIDSVNRLRTLLNQMPNIKKKSPGFVLFLRKTANVENLRNHFQHLNQEIKEMVNNKSTAFGVLEWVIPIGAPPTGCYVYSLQSGTILNRGFPILNPLGKNLESPICLITLTAGNLSMCLSDIMAEVAKLTAGLEKGLENQTNGLPQAGADLLFMLEFSFGDEK